MNILPPILHRHHAPIYPHDAPPASTTDATLAQAHQHGAAQLQQWLGQAPAMQAGRNVVHWTTVGIGERAVASALALVQEALARPESPSRRAALRQLLQRYAAAIRQRLGERLQLGGCLSLAIGKQHSMTVLQTLDAACHALDAEQRQRALRKSVPYESPAHGTRVNLNGKVRSLDPAPHRLWCRHLATAYVESALAHPTHKVARVRLATANLLHRWVGPDSERRHARLTQSSAWLFDTAAFGQLLQQWFEQMQQQGRPERALVLETASHAMAVQLRIKPGRAGDGPQYVVKFYDPNRTNSHMRCAVRAPAALAGMHLRQFCALGYAAYFDQEDAVIAFEPSADGQPDPSVQVRAPKALARALGLLLSNGRAAGMTALLPALQQLAPAALPAVLRAASRRGHSGLYFALQNSHAAAITAFKQLLQGLPLHGAALAELLAGRHGDGSPGLQIALQCANAATIAAYADLLGLLPTAARLVLLAARFRNQCGLELALVEGNAAAIDAYAAVLNALPPADRLAVLAMMQLDQTAEREAAHNGHDAALAAYRRLLAGPQWPLPPRVRRHG